MKISVKGIGMQIVAPIDLILDQEPIFLNVNSNSIKVLKTH